MDFTTKKFIDQQATVRHGTAKQEKGGSPLLAFDSVKQHPTHIPKSISARLISHTRTLNNLTDKYFSGLWQIEGDRRSPDERGLLIKE